MKKKATIVYLTIKNEMPALSQCFECLQLKESTAALRSQCLDFTSFSNRNPLFQRCPLKKASNVSKGQVLADKFGGWQFSLLLSFHHPPK
jgi:hypothetical protein